MSEQLQFTLATEIVNFTSQHVFITGKAGTGKTTFLKHIAEHTTKNFAIVAPTGVAAMHAGGVTMHSFLQLPMGAFIPVPLHFYDGSFAVTDIHSLFKNTHFHKNKLELLRELELLIIDEVSMVRADMLEATDAILKFARRNSLPFGGVQMVYIGDLYQLPPVVKDDEWSLLKNYYDSPFFFDAPSLKKSNIINIELKKIYRQTDAAFIHILNQIRNNTLQETTLDTLHQRFNPNYIASKNEITLCTHNYKADAINEEKLQNIDSELIQYNASMQGDINEQNILADKHLKLKVGAQVMFLKNEPNGEYYNGKIGIICSLKKEEIKVQFTNTSTPYTLQKHTWRNIKYTLDKNTSKIKEDEVGTFEQYPIKLAWAITIHKSQGLTFENVVIDAGQSFAAGQVYVALSRCTQFNGITLLSKITPDNIRTEPNIATFLQTEATNDRLQHIIDNEKKQYIGKQLLSYFSFDKTTYAIQLFANELPQRQINNAQATYLFFKEIEDRCLLLQKHAENFKKELQTILHKPEPDTILLKERCTKAIHYFCKEIQDKLLAPIQNFELKLQKEKRVKGLLKDINELLLSIEKLYTTIQKTKYGNLQFIENTIPTTQATANVPKKNKVGGTKYVSKEMLADGKTIEQIADERNMAYSTIESHLCALTATAELNIFDWVPKEKIKTIQTQIQQQDSVNIMELKTKLGDAYTYNEIKAVLAYNKLDK